MATLRRYQIEGVNHLKANQREVDMLETWKEIPGYEGRYFVSDLGNVMSAPWIDTIGRRVASKRLKQSKSSKGYHHVCLVHPIDGNKTASVHRLVMAAFHGENSLVVDHINETPSDNRLVNLRYVTHRENCQYARQHKKGNGRCGWYVNKRGKYIAQFKRGGEVNYIGSFDTADEAADAYDAAVERYENA